MRGEQTQGLFARRVTELGEPSEASMDAQTIPRSQRRGELAALTVALFGKRSAKPPSSVAAPSSPCGMAQSCCAAADAARQNRPSAASAAG